MKSLATVLCVLFGISYKQRLFQTNAICTLERFEVMDCWDRFRTMIADETWLDSAGCRHKELAK